MSLSRYSPSEILVNSAVLDFTQLPDFIRNRLSASLELLEDGEYEQQKTTEEVQEQFGGKTLEDLEPGGQAGTDGCTWRAVFLFASHSAHRRRAYCFRAALQWCTVHEA